MTIERLNQRGRYRSPKRPFSRAELTFLVGFLATFAAAAINAFSEGMQALGAF